MKRVIVICVALCIALALVSCGSAPTTKTTTTTTTVTTTTSGPAAPVERKVNNSVPQFVKDAMKKAPEDALVGIGSAKMGTQSLSRTTATTRARAEISRTMETMIKDMVRDYTASSEVDPSATISFTENITVALSKAELKGAEVVDFDYTEDNTCWVVVVLSKKNSAEQIDQVQAAAKLAVPAMISFDAEARMDDAFAKVYAEEVGYADKD